MHKKSHPLTRLFILALLLVAVIAGISYFQHLETLSEEEAKLIENYSNYRVVLVHEGGVPVVKVHDRIDNRTVISVPYEQWGADMVQQYGPIENEDEVLRHRIG